MSYGVLADLVVALHAAFLVFVVLGGLLVARWPRVAWLHLPCVIWGVALIATGLECPLTGLEKWFIESGGAEPYAGGFVDHYVEDIVYPDELTPVLWAVAVGCFVVGYRRAWSVAAKPRQGRPRQDSNLRRTV